MPRLPAVRLNKALTLRNHQASRADLIPNLKQIQAELPDPDDQHDLIDAMVETMLYGKRHATGQNPVQPDPELRTQFPHVFKPTPGRQLWGWSHIHKLTEHKDLNQLANQLKPSDQSITPLHAFITMPDTLTDIFRLSIELGGPKGRSGPWAYMEWQDFGRPYNDYYFLTDYHGIDYTPPKNSRRTPPLHYACQIDPGGNLPLASILMKYPPVYQELNESLRAAYLRAKETLIRGPGNAFTKATHDLLARHPSDPPPQVLRLIFGCHDYNGPVPWDRLYDPTISPDEHANIVVARQLLQQRHQSGASNVYLTMAISLLSGVSPASFALAAIDRLQRTGMSFLDEGDILAMAGLLSNFDEPRGILQKEQRAELLDQLEQLAIEMAAATDRLAASLVEEAYTTLHDRGALPAWGRYGDSSLEE